QARDVPELLLCVKHNGDRVWRIRRERLPDAPVLLLQELDDLPRAGFVARPLDPAGEVSAACLVRSIVPLFLSTPLTEPCFELARAGGTFERRLLDVKGA